MKKFRDDRKQKVKQMMRGRSPRYIAELRRRNPHAQTPDVGYFGGLELDAGYSVKARKHKDFVLMYGAIINGLISKALARFVSNENLIREIMYGDIQEKTFVRNFVKKFVTEIDYAIKTGGYPDEIVAEKNQFKSALLKATTIKDLLRIFPLNKQLQKIDGLFTEARRRVNR